MVTGIGIFYEVMIDICEKWGEMLVVNLLQQLKGNAMLEKVDFGTVDAESETKLRQFFVDNGTLTRIRENKKYLVLGRKGSGKTALFKAAGDVYKEPCLPLLFKDYHWEYHKTIKEMGLPAESAFTKSWMFTILVQIIRYWNENSADSSLTSATKKMLIEIFGSEYKTIGNRLIDVFTRFKKIGLTFPAGVGGNLELNTQTGPILADNISSITQQLEKFVVTNFANSSVVVLLDQLDDGWDNSVDSKNLIIGCLKATKDLNNLLQSLAGYPPVITFLRDDIYSELKFNDKNKMFQGSEFLEWDEAGLIQIIAKRIAVAFKLDTKKHGVDTILGNVFTREEMRSRANYKTYVIQRTMMRPRDIVAFVDQCKVVAIESGAKKISKEHIYKAEERFSNHIYDELIDETHKQFPIFEGCMNLLREIGKTKIRHIDIETAIKGAKYASLEPENIEQLLYQFGVIGVPQSGGQARTGGAAYYFKERTFRPDFKKGLMVVHPSLKKYLKLTEPRNRK